VGRIVNKPAEWQGEIALRKRITLSLTFDHRVVDGAPAARFLNRVREYVEDPYLWVMR
jgi:pyruvate dehydrogenase E2 component (dihydrolipoamide acetyltransferase)